MNTLSGFLSVVLPTGMITSLGRELGLKLLDVHTLQIGTQENSFKPAFSITNMASTPATATGTGSGTGSGSGSGSGSGTGSGTGSGSGSGSAPAQNPKQAIIDRYSGVNQNNLLQFLASGGDPGFHVQDPQGIGARGYNHGGINQPYASSLAQELKNQGVSGKTYYPKLDANAKRFLADALPHIRPEVYGPQPSVVNNASMIVQATIKKLEKMP